MSAIPQSIVFHAPATPFAITNIPAALTEQFGATGRNRTVHDLGAATQARIAAAVVASAGNASAVLAAQYSPNAGASWFFLDGASGPAAAIATTGVRVSPWAAHAASARGDVQLRPVTVSGDGAADPQIGLTTLQVR